MSRQKLAILSAVLAVAAVAAVLEFAPRTSPAPAPAPSPDAGYSLRGRWVGPRAAEDAAAFAGLCRGLADALEVDGTASQPRITSGVQIEDIRIAAAEGRFLPRKLTQDQPHAVAVAGRYLDEHAGTSGGPIDAESRGRWVKSLRDLAQLAEDSVR
jgi:hypothetical protein